MKGQRRLYRWVEEWPSRPPEGYFRISEAVWLDEQRRIPVAGVVALLLPASDVEMIEFMESGERAE